MSEHKDDSEMNRFDRTGVRLFTAREAVGATMLVAVILLFVSGGSILSSANEQPAGPDRAALTTIGKPGAKIASLLPLQRTYNELTSSLSPEPKLDPGDSFANQGVIPGDAGSTVTIPPVTPDSFDPVELGEPAPPHKPLETLLVTGDSLSQPLDSELARRLTGDGVEVDRDPHVGTGLSNDALVDWGQLSAAQMKEFDPDAVVVFIGANEGYPLPDGKRDVNCCGVDWAVILASRMRQVMANYRDGGRRLVYWLTVPVPRSQARQRIANVVNQSALVAAEPWRSDVRVLDVNQIFSPDGKYSDSVSVDGKQTIVRESDGIHLNDIGASLEADQVMARLDTDFGR